MPTESTERRRQPRTNLSEVIFIRPSDSRLPPDSCTTVNISQDGLYLATLADHYAPGVNVYVTGDFRPDSSINYATAGVVVRVEKLRDDKWGVAIHIFSPSASTVH
jgi:PilZ domain